MSGHQTATVNDTVYFYFAANDTSGSGGDGATPLFDVREAGAAAGAIPLLSGTPTLLTHANYPAGCFEVAVAATTGNGFAADDTFAVFCTLAIDSQNPTGFVGSCTLTPLAKVAALATVDTVVDGIQTDLDNGTDGLGAIKTSVDAIPTTAMRGTDSAALASVATEARLAELDAANLPTDIAAIPTTAMRGTDSAALASVCTEGRLAELDAANLPADRAAIEARFDGVEGATFATGTDSLEAIRDRGDAAWTTGAGGSNPYVLQNTTIATLATQVSFTLTAGSADDGAYVGMLAIVEDSATATQKAVGVISAYTGATKTITLREDPGVFTMAVGDTIDVVVVSPDILDILADSSELQTVLSAGILARSNNATLETLLGVDDDAAEDNVAFQVWEELLTGGTHNVGTSAGRRLRQLQESGSVYNGQVYVDTIDGVAGTTAYENGTTDNPVNLIASAKTIAAAVGGGLHDFHIINGSAITLAESTANESYFGDNWTLALNSQDVAGAYFQGAEVSGVGTSASEVHYEGCDIGTMSVQIGHFDFCAFSGTVTMTLAGDYKYHNCYSNIAGAGAPVFTKTAGQAITAAWRNWMDSITVSGLQAGDVATINGRLGTVTLNGADATVEIRGTYKALVNNLTGAPTVNLDGAILAADVADILVDTADMQPKLGTPAADLAADVAAVKTVVDGIPTTAMRGTDSAALASVCTEGRLAELDAGNLPTDIAAIPTTAMRGTDNAATEAKQDIIDTNVDQIETAVITNAAGVDIAADIITVKAETATIVADTNELQTDDVPGLIAALNNLAASDVLTTALTESYNADGSAPTLAQALFVIMQLLTEKTVAGTTVTIKKIDGSTTALTLTLDDGTSPTSITRAT
ncbi:MAG: hypothetical protein V3U60_11185 [Gammaproteobacteria bacterium]